MRAELPPLTPLEIANRRHQLDLVDIEAEVRQIHHADTDLVDNVCAVCVDPATLAPELWPCPTLRVVRKMVRMSRS